VWSYALRETMVPLPESLENRFPEYLAVTSRVGCHEYQQIFVSSGHFLILKGAKNCKGISQVTKVVGLLL
jgi:hypothetical protein